MAGARRRRGATAFSDPDDGSFDISDVDTTSFPIVDCDSLIVRYGFSRQHCGWAVGELSELGVAGYAGGNGNVYVQVKASSADAPEAEAAKEAILRIKYRSQFDADRLVIVPVKYDYEQLWRWATVLKRFSRSSGNTLGITSSVMGHNGRGLFPSDETVYPLSGLREVDREDSPAGIRTTIVVLTRDLQGTVDALPRLLKQFKIPEDAVGLVVEKKSRLGGRLERLGSSSAESEGVRGWVASARDSATMPVLIGGAAVVGLMLLFAVFVGVRKVRR